jgi:hypothetical protein
MRQYVPATAWAAIARALAEAGRAATPDAPLAWVTMEPAADRAAGCEVVATTWPGGERRLLAMAGYHGPPVRWRTPAGANT